ALDGEEALGRAGLAVAVAGGAGDGLRAFLAAGAVAGIAGDRGRNADIGLLAVEGFLERDLHVVAKIGAATPRGLATPSAAHELAEHRVEDVGEVEPAPGEALAVPAAHPAVLEGGMAESVIGRALLLVLEDVVGL